jgi:hypothetical protein
MFPFVLGTMSVRPVADNPIKTGAKLGRLFLSRQIDVLLLSVLARPLLHQRFSVGLIEAAFAAKAIVS